MPRVFESRENGFDDASAAAAALVLPATDESSVRPLAHRKLYIAWEQFMRRLYRRENGVRGRSKEFTCIRKGVAISNARNNTRTAAALTLAVGHGTIVLPLSSVQLFRLCVCGVQAVGSKESPT